MDQFNHHSSNSLSLDQLVSRALDRLKQIGCSKRSLRRYQTIWEHLIEFSHQKQLGDEYSENLATRFIGEYRLKEGEDVKPRYGWQRHIVFSMKVIGDFAHDRRIERCVTDMQKIHVPPVMKNALRDYEQFCKDRWHLRSTSLRATIREVTIFLNFLRLRKLETLDRIQADRSVCICILT